MSDEEGKNLGGRPTKYKKEYEEQVYKLCLLGADDDEIADFFNVSITTIDNWKENHDRFLGSIKEGKRVADMNVAHSLYNRAIGFDYTEVKEESGSSEAGAFEKTVTTTKKVVPDVRAQQIWLMNRQRSRWTDTKHVESKVTIEQPLFPLVKDVPSDDSDK